MVSKLFNALKGAVIVGVSTAVIVFFGLPLLGDLGNLTPEFLALSGGVILTFALDKLPFLSNWFNGLDGENKGFVSAGGVVGLGVALFVLSCAGRVNAAAAIACSLSGAVGLIAIILQALVASQATYLALVKPKK